MQTMRREGLTEVLTNDRHFEQEGSAPCSGIPDSAGEMWNGTALIVTAKLTAQKAAQVRVVYLKGRGLSSMKTIAGHSTRLRT